MVYKYNDNTQEKDAFVLLILANLIQNQSAWIFLFVILVEVPQNHRHPAQEEAEEKQGRSGKDYHHGDSGSERIHKDDHGQEKQKHSSQDGPGRSLYTEGLKVTSECNDHERMVHHPYAEHHRKEGHAYRRIYAEEETQKQIYDASHQDISPHRQVVRTGRGNDQLGRSHKYHEDTCKYTQGHITFKRENKDGDSRRETEDARKHHEPPVLHRTAGSFSQVFKMTFHGTNN